LSVPPDGIFGGKAGEAGRFVVNGTPITTQSRVTLQPGDVVRLDLPGGGGFGAPAPANPEEAEVTTL
jgi:N-methylhydantoinase B